MLVLQRDIMEAVVLTLPDGRQVTITVLPRKDRRKSIRLGFEAPADVKIVRSELLDREEVGT